MKSKDCFLDSDTMRAMVRLGRGVELHIDAEIGSPLQGMQLYLPFTGSERICWECEGERYLMLDMNLRGKIFSWNDICDPFDDTSMSMLRYKRKTGDR